MPSNLLLIISQLFVSAGALFLAAGLADILLISKNDELKVVIKKAARGISLEIFGATILLFATQI